MDELALIKKVDRQPKAKIDSVLLSDGPAYVLLYLRLLKKLTRVDTIQIILVLIADSLAGMSLLDLAVRCLKLSADHEERVALYTRTAESEPDLPHGPLLKCVCPLCTISCTQSSLGRYRRVMTSLLNSRQLRF